MSEGSERNDQLEYNKFLASVPWTRLHGGLDLLGECCLVAAAVSAYVTLGAVALPYLIASVFIIPDMVHSMACAFWGDGSHASAERSRELAASGNYVDPQDRYNDGVKSLGQLFSHYLRRNRLDNEELAAAKQNALYLKRITYDLKNHPNETGRIYEGVGKLAQMAMGTAAAVSFNPVGGALQAMSGGLNAAAVGADMLPESESDSKGILAHFKRNNQKYAAGAQLIATAMYIPTAIAFGIATPIGMALMGAVTFWGLGYGTKFFATKRGYAID